MVSWGQSVTSEDRYITIKITYLGFEYRSVHDGDRRGFTVKPTAKYIDECLDICSTVVRKGSDDAFDGTEEFESA